MNHSYEDQGKNAPDVSEYQGVTSGFNSKAYLEQLRKKIPPVEGIEKGMEVKE